MSTPIRVTRKRRDAYQHGDLRRALVQAGLKLLSEGGIPNLSLRAAAELAGVSHAAPYRHFQDKDALLAAIAEEGFRILTARMREEIAARGPEADLLVRFSASGVGYVSFAVEHPAYLRLIFGGTMSPEAAVPPSLQAAGQEAYSVLRDLVSEGIATGRFRPGDPDHHSLTAWSLVHGLSMLLIDGRVRPGERGAPDVPALTESIIRMLGEGLVTEPAAKG
jgi:AcrR family transcriptional regulator